MNFDKNAVEEMSYQAEEDALKKPANRNVNFEELPTLHVSLSGVSADGLNLPSKSLKIFEKPVWSSSKASKSSMSPEQQQQPQPLSQPNSPSRKYIQLSRPESSQSQSDKTVLPAISKSNVLLAGIGGGASVASVALAHNKNLTTQPGAPIVLNTKTYQQSDSTIPSGNNSLNLENSLNRFKIDSNLDPKRSATKLLTKIKTEPNFEVSSASITLTDFGSVGESISSEAGITMQSIKTPHHASNQFLKHVDSSMSLNGKKNPCDSSEDFFFGGQQQQLSREDKEALLKEFDLKTTVGTGTFGHVVMVKSTSLNKYFALKIMSIVEIIKRKQIQHVKNEKAILESIKSHPFLVKLYWTHRDHKNIYFLFEYVPGGELFSVLRQKVRFKIEEAVFYTSEIVCAVEFLHSLNIVYRDLKPENILLDKDGHIKLTDMGFAKKCFDKTYTLCGTPEYLAPEVLSNRGHNLTCDWWSLGVIIFEFLSGTPPFYDENRDKVYQKILAARIEWPRHFDSVSKDLIKKLLIPDPTKRLGSGNCGVVSFANLKQLKKESSTPSLPSLTNITPTKTATTNERDATITTTTEQSDGVFLTESIVELIPLNNSNTSIGDSSSSSSPPPPPPNSLLDHATFKRQKITMGSEEVKRHRWFISVADWGDVYMRKLKPPFVPIVAHEGDTQNFEKYDAFDFFKVPAASELQIDHFKNF